MFLQSSESAINMSGFSDSELSTAFDNRRTAPLSERTGEEPGVGLRRLFWRGMWEHAILRWESATLVSLALIGAAGGWTAAAIGIVPGWSWPVVPLLCLAGESILVWTSLRDPDTNREVVGRLLLDTYRPHQLSDPALCRQVLAALDLRARIEALTRAARSLDRANAHAGLALQFDSWIGILCRLATQLDRFKSELGFSDDQARDTAVRTRHLEKLAEVESDPTTCREIEATIAGHEALLGNLYQVRKAVERADLRLERSVSQLATIHAQVILLVARGAQGDSVLSLSSEIDVEILNLQAMARAMDRASTEPPDFGEPVRPERLENHQTAENGP
jgi:hypothetical protein